jgi:hypothetical protein
MAQIFHPSANTLSRVSIYGALFVVVGLLFVSYAIIRSPYQTMQRVIKDQPVQFSHEHHVSGLGIDCRYCHTSVEHSSSAGMPSTETCMSCHSQIWSDSPMLAPVRASYRDNTPIRWNRVHDLPDFAYFHHGVHIQKGVGCVTCHGRVDKMPLMWKEAPMTMQWCLECHRNPAPHLRPYDQIFNMAGQSTTEAANVGQDANVNPDARRDDASRNRDAHFSGMTNCSVCHR